MKDFYKQQYELSLFINVLRDQLLKKGFFEHHLYSTLNYKIENTETFKLKEDLYLRYNPEPDIWQVGLKHDEFFWIGSMFRDEKKISSLHRNEFTVFDVYQSNGTVDRAVDLFVELLKALEQKLDLTALSGLEFKYTTHAEFAQEKTKGTHWLVVTDYPTEESFYDAQGKEQASTQKFEIFFVGKGESIEIAACGKLGTNLNKTNYISDHEEVFVNQSLLEKDFIGFGIGLERLVSLYQ